MLKSEKTFRIAIRRLYVMTEVSLPPQNNWNLFVIPPYFHFFCRSSSSFSSDDQSIHFCPPPPPTFSPPFCIAPSSQNTCFRRCKIAVSLSFFCCEIRLFHHFSYASFFMIRVLPPTYFLARNFFFWIFELFLNRTEFVGLGKGKQPLNYVLRGFR